MDGDLNTMVSRSATMMVPGPIIHPIKKTNLVIFKKGGEPKTKGGYSVAMIKHRITLLFLIRKARSTSEKEYI